MRFVWPALMLVAAGVSPLVGNEPSREVVNGGLALSRKRSDVSPDQAPTAAASNPELRGSGLSIRSIETHIGRDGAQDFVIVFDGPVPNAGIDYVDDIKNVDASRAAYTTQEWTPARPTPLSTCGDQHFGFSPPAVVGQLNVLMPGDWFEAPPEADKIIWQEHPQGYGLKTPLWGPHDGYVQLAIWSPASHDPDDIRVYFDDLTRLVAEIRPEAVGPSA